MKKNLIYLLLLLAFSCKKDQAPAPAPAETLSLADAKSYITDRPAMQTSGTGQNFDLSRLAIPWEKAESLRNKTGNYWLVALGGRPTFANVPQGYRKLALMRDSSGRIRAYILEIVPDGITYQRQRQVRTADFTGRIFTYDEQYHLLGGAVYIGGKQKGRIRPSVSTPRKQVEELYIVDNCDWYDNNYFDADGVLTIFSEQLCSTTIYDDGVGGGGGMPDLGSGDYAGGGGGGGGDSSGVPEVSNLPGASGPGVNASAYTKCFGNIPVNSSTHMQVTVYVQEPFPGTSFNIGPNSVGHTAIGLTETTGGASITQTLGFYPDASGKDKMHAPAKIVDNSGLDYQVSISFQVDALQFANLINYLNSPLPAYDITGFNCTGYVNAACQYAGINLPSPYTTIGLPYPDGTVSQAMAPAGLANSIRNMQGQTGVNTDGGKVGISNGPCN